MDVTILGHWGAYPKAGEATSGYLLEHKGKRVLLDCGSGVLAILQKYTSLDRTSTVLISHDHHDHIADLGCLQYACLIDTDLNKRTNPLDIYVAGMKFTQEAAYRSMKGSDLKPLTETDALFIGGMELTFFQTFHEVYCLATKVKCEDKTLVYTADTYFDESLIGFCRNADVLIAETSFYAQFHNARNYGHMNAAEVGHLARMADVDKVVLTHLPHFGNTSALVEEVKQTYQGEVILAECGLRIGL